MAGLGVDERELGPQVAGETRRDEPGRRRGSRPGERLLIERLGEDRFDGRVAEAGKEVGAGTGGPGARDGEALEVADDLLRGAQLEEDVVRGEDYGVPRAEVDTSGLLKRELEIG
jgi:hypothetical protein